MAGAEDVVTLVDRIIAYADAQDGEDELIHTDVESFAVVRNRSSAVLEGYVYQPILCLILQGEKETQVGDHTVQVSAGQSLIVSHDLPVMACVMGASAARPYVALVLKLDLGIARSLQGDLGDAPPDPGPSRAMEVGPTEPALLDAMGRLFDLIGKPEDAQVLRPLILREIHYRILTSPQGRMIRRLLRRDSHASRISVALQRIQEAYARPLAIPALAELVGMSASTFHAHFKAVTGTTPLQYQKDLRLLAARRMLQEGVPTVSAAAFAVGYESAPQFSREYGRKFGVPPRAELARRVT